MNYSNQYFKSGRVLENFSGNQLPKRVLSEVTIHKAGGFVQSEHRLLGYNFNSLLFKHDDINYFRSRAC